MFLGVFSTLCLVTWLYLRPAYSPTQSLDPVAYTAFSISPPTEVAGYALAQAVRGWQGVTASTYNHQSGLLVICHTEKAPEASLLDRLQILSATKVSKKVFPEPVGPKCPVPQAAFAALPTGFLLLGMAGFMGFLGAYVFGKKKLI